jgi:ribosomal-protein-alanine N-acetyltransferase
LQHVFEKFKEHRVAFLEVRKSNTAAIGLYERFNFKRIHIRKKYYSDGEDAIIMQRNAALNKK